MRMDRRGEAGVVIRERDGEGKAAIERSSNIFKKLCFL